MKKKLQAGVVGIFLLFCMTGIVVNANAASFAFEQEGLFQGVVAGTTLKLAFGVPAGSFDYSKEVTVLDGLRSTDIGKTFVFTGDSFSFTSQHLANGINEFFWYRTTQDSGGGNGMGLHEAFMFWDSTDESAAGQLGPSGKIDLLGFTINQITLSLNDMEQSDNFVRIKTTLTVDATPTPIPGAIWLLGTGLLGLVGFRRKINK